MSKTEDAIDLLTKLVSKHDEQLSSIEEKIDALREEKDRRSKPNRNAPDVIYSDNYDRDADSVPEVRASLKAKVRGGKTVDLSQLSDKELDYLLCEVVEKKYFR